MQDPEPAVVVERTRRRRCEPVVWRAGERGQGMLEYLLILVFVVLAGVTIWRTFGDNLRAMLRDANNRIVDEHRAMEADSGDVRRIGGQ